ncbi:hypothetical protein NIES4101_46270 [Calothrix sp. NIES-4101]|nr:hypothetical protein NIES4101_46270 [Calothrix sp. NIES-4101]
MPFLDNSIIATSNNSSIYTGTEEPNSPEIGMIWNEVDVSGNFVAKWEAFDHPDYQWRSVERIANMQQPINISFNAARAHYFGIEYTNNDILVTKLEHVQYITNNTLPPNTLTFQLQQVTKASPSITVNNITNLVVTNVTANSMVREKIAINTVFPKDSIKEKTFRYLATPSSGHSTNLVLHVDIHYFLLR